MGINVYDVVNKRIVELLEQGTVPWKKPWNAKSNMPKNITGREYRGLNIFLLATQEYSSPYWMTFKQASDKQGYIRKGEKSIPVIFWKWLDRKGAGVSDEQCSRTGKIPLLRYYSVFNLEQIEGIEPPELEETVNEFNPIETAEKILADMPQKPEVRYGGNQASYSPTFDFIKMPYQQTFNSSEEYYSTLFHELSHATGHISRLARKSILEPSYFGSHEYSKEELVAEMGAAFLCGFSGIEQRTLDNSAAYLQGWLKSLKNDKTLLVQAGGMAQKACDFILRRKLGEEGDCA